jgi:hypothetical protein
MRKKKVPNLPESKQIPHFVHADAEKPCSKRARRVITVKRNATQ